MILPFYHSDFEWLLAKRRQKGKNKAETHFVHRPSVLGLNQRLLTLLSFIPSFEGSAFWPRFNSLLIIFAALNYPAFLS